MPAVDHSLSIESFLQPICRRLRSRSIAQFGTIGLTVGCFAVFVLTCLSLAEISISWYAYAISLTACAGLGAIVGALVPVSLRQSATLVDHFYRLKDRALTALQFEDDTDPMRQMQVADTRAHLRQVRAADCVSIQVNRPLLTCCGSFLAMSLAAMLFSSLEQRGQLVTPVVLASQQAVSLRQTMIEELEQLKSELPELESLVEKLDELIDELANESIDERDMMATLSEMEQAINEARESLQLEMTDAQLKGLAEALLPSDLMKQAVAAIEGGEYDKAGEKLESIDPNKLNDKERRAVADNLKKFLAKLSPGQQGELSNAAGELQEGLEKKNDSQCKSGLCKLAGVCRQQSNCEKIGQCMACQLNRLAQCKCECRGSCSSDKVAKSTSPSTTFGLGATGAANDGEATKLDSVRREESLTGAQGDGPSESELIEAPEGDQEAARQFVKRYEKFRNQAEAVLETESLPLGHRETVRQYFENIRPANADQ